MGMEQSPQPIQPPESTETEDALLDSPEEAPPPTSSLEDAAFAVSALEGEFIAAETRPQFDELFRRAQELAQQLESDERLGPLERAAVDQHLREFLMRARVTYDRNRGCSQVRSDRKHREAGVSGRVSGRR